MRSTLESTLPWWVAGPVLGLVIISLLGLANKRFGVVGGVTDLVQGSAEGRGLRSWRALLVVGIVFGGLAYTLLAGAPDAGTAYSWLDAHLSAGGEVAVLFGAGLLQVLLTAPGGLAQQFPKDMANLARLIRRGLGKVVGRGAA